MLVGRFLRRHTFQLARMFSTNNSSDKLPATVDIETTTNEEMEQRSKQLFQKHTQLQKAFDEQLPFFYKMYGTKDKYEVKTSFMANRLMGFYGVHQSALTQYFLKIFKGTLYAAVQKDDKFLEEYVEKSLGERIKMDMATMEKKQIKLNAVQERSHQLLDFKDGAELVELALVRGLSMDRDKNKPLNEYNKYTDDEEIGLTIYTPKYLANPDAFIDPSANKTIYDEHSSLLVMRVLARVRTSLRLKSRQLSIKDQLYTWEHLCIFENQMAPPKKWTSSYKLETYLEWLSKFKFGLWRLADIDNCMRGNSLIREGLQKQFTEEVFEHSKYDTKETIDIKQVDR